MDAYVKKIVVDGYECEVYACEGEGLLGYVNDFPDLEVSADTLEDLRYNISVALQVEEEMARIWYDGQDPRDEEEMDS